MVDIEWRKKHLIILREEKYQQVLCSHTAVLYAEGVLMYQQASKSYSTAIAQHHEFIWDQKFISPIEWQATLPVRILQL